MLGTRSLSIREFFKYSQDEFLQLVVGSQKVVENLETITIRRTGVASLSSNGKGDLICRLNGYLGYINTEFLVAETTGHIQMQEGGGSDFALYYFYKLLSGSRGLTENVEFCASEIEIRDVLSSLFSGGVETVYLREVGLISNARAALKSRQDASEDSERGSKLKKIIRAVDRELDFTTTDEIEEDILNRFYFEFSDGRIFSLATVFYSPYAELLPSELIPEPGAVSAECAEGYYSWADHCRVGSSNEADAKAQLELLSFFVSRSRGLVESEKIQFYISEGVTKEAKKHRVRAIGLESIEIDWFLQMSKEDIFLKGKVPSSEVSVFNSGSRSFLDEVSGVLSFNNLYADIEKVNRVSRACGSHKLENNTVRFDKDSAILIFGEGTPLRLIKEELKKNGVKYCNEVEEVTCRGGDKIIADFSSGESAEVKVAIVYEGEGINRAFEGGSGWLKAILRGLNGGLAGYFDQDIERLATTNFSKRSIELRLYRHTGLFFLLLLECLKYIRTENNEKDIEKFTMTLVLKLEEFILDLLSRKDTEAVGNLEALVSNSFIFRMKSLAQIICDEEGLIESFYSDGKCWHVHYDRSLVNFVELLSEVPLGVYSGKAFSRVSFKCLEIYSSKVDSSSQKEQNENPILDGGEFIVRSTKGLDFRSFSKKAECRIDGSNIEALIDTDLVTEFHLMEKSGSENWFDLNPKVFFKGEEVSKETANRFLKDPVIFHKGKYYFIPENQVPALKWLDYFWERLHSDKESSATADVSKEENPVIGSIKSDVLNMLALRSAGVAVFGGPRWDGICREFDQLKDFSPEEHEALKLEMVQRLSNFKTELKDFQLEGVLWLKQIYNLGLGGILSDEMGLGKTVQSLAFLEDLRCQGELGTNLIVVPTSLVYNWSSEIKRFCPHMTVDVFESKKVKEFERSLKSDGDRLVICTYGLLVENSSFFEKQKWNVIFFDEAQSVKNIKAKRRGAAASLVAKCKVCITGTPMENHYGEFFSVIDLVVPGAVGTYTDFMKVYKFRGESPITIEDIEFLKKKVRPLVLRRSKSQVLSELPDKSESVISLEFDEQQEKIYRDIAISWNTKIRTLVEAKGESKSQIEMLTALMRLRQACSCPRAIPNVTYDQPTPKEELLIRNITELIENKESVIVFTNFLTSLELLKERFTAEGLPFLSLCGRDSIKKREQTLRQFSESDEPYILAMTLKTGGVGLNLTKASYVIHFEPWWNPAAENQGTDRVHRIGQKRAVQVYRYIMKDSVEEKIQDLKKVKSSAFEALFNECESTAESELKGNISLSKSSLTQKDFEILLG